VTDFFGNFLLALLLVGLIRFLYAVCALLVRTRDGGNIAFAIALPVALLYIAVRNPVPVGSWAGLGAGTVLGAVLLLALARWRRRS
jgi:hypothetical protein